MQVTHARIMEEAGAGSYSDRGEMSCSGRREGQIQRRHWPAACLSASPACKGTTQPCTFFFVPFVKEGCPTHASCYTGPWVLTGCAWSRENGERWLGLCISNTCHALAIRRPAGGSLQKMHTGRSVDVDASQRMTTIDHPAGRRVRG